MRIKATIVAYAFLVQCFENATIVAYAGLRVKPGTCQPAANAQLVLKSFLCRHLYVCVFVCLRVYMSCPQGY